MGDVKIELTGPDFAQGVNQDAVVQNQPLLGHAFGEAILLVRDGDEIFAVSAICPHYQAPLANGLQVNGTIRCPMHHAVFDVRSGEATAPSPNRLTCFSIERVGNAVRVTGQRQHQPPPKGTSTSLNAVVIVGAGAAGHAAAETLRNAGYAGSISVIGADANAPYDRPNVSKDYLAGTAPEAWMPLRPPSFFTEQNIGLKLGVRATRIDRDTRSVLLSDGTTLAYDALLLATGAEPNRLTIPGADLPHVHTLRTLADSRSIISQLGDAKQAVVVGASFIGLEVAASLRARNLSVHVVAPDALPFKRVLGPELGQFFKQLHEDNGVIFHLGQTPKAIDRQQGVTLESGEVIAADVVVAGVGVQPAIDLAVAAGLEIDRGVIVNEFLQTSDRNIYAVGDIARWPDKYSGEKICVEHWVVAQRQGQTAARNILGQKVPFDVIPFFWTSQFGVTVNYVGHASTWDRIDIDGSVAARDCTLRYVKNDRLVAVATIGRDIESLKAELEMENGITYRGTI